MSTGGVAALTARERDVLRALAAGRSSKQVASDLGLTVATVRSYTKAIYATLDVHNRAEATLAAIEAGLAGDKALTDDRDRHTRSLDIAPPVRPVIGRQRERTALRGLLLDGRLVSVVGVGGAGKTVLARTVAHEHVDATGQRGALALLEHVDDEVGLALAIAEALEARVRSAGAGVWHELARVAGDAPCLLVLDNLEHLVGHADRLLGLLASLPSLRLLTTSRQPLGVAEETVLRIDGLSVPADHLTPPTGHGAVELFVTEVARIDPQRRLGPRDLGTVGEICRLVGGWPLAVVLAAGWIDVLSLDDIVAELAAGSDLLTSESVLPERHRSMAALVDASITRRPLPEQQVLARMSVFAGGFDRDAAQAVAGCSLQRLASLIRASLVRHDPIADRYDLHPLVRGRAAVLLEEHRHTATTRAAHRDHYAGYTAGWAEAMAGRPQPPGQREAVAALGRERDNIREAWGHAATTGDADRLLEMVAPLTRWLDHLSDLVECETLLTAAIDSHVAPGLWARLVLHREYLRLQSGTIDPASCPADEALAVLVAEGDDWLPAAEVIVAFLEASVLGRPEQAFERARHLTASCAPTPPFWRHRGLLLLGLVLAGAGDPHAAVRTHLDGMRDALAAGDHSAAHVLLVLATLGLIRVHRLADVPAMLEQAEDLQAQLPNAQTEASVQLIELIMAVLAAEDVDELERRLQDPAVLRILRENRQMANLRNGALGLARGAGGDRAGAEAGREAQDDHVAAGLLPESVLWAELGIALAALAAGDLDDARAHAEAARPWEQGAGMVASEVDVLLDVIEAVAVDRDGEGVQARALLDRALSSPSLLTSVLRHSAAVGQLGMS